MARKEKGMTEEKVIIEIPVTGKIKIYPVGKCETLKGLSELNKRIKDLPIKKITALEGIGVMRYENCYCIVIEHAGMQFVFCFGCDDH